MKKRFLGLGLLLVVLLSSCASIPKEVKEGDTLVIGEIVYQASGYDSKSPYGNLNGTKKNAIEVNLYNTVTQQTKRVITGTNGKIVLKNLKEGEAWYISKVKLQVTGNSGTYTVWCNNPVSKKTFMAYDNKVVNLGRIIFTFDGKANMCYFNFGRHEDVLYDFQEWAEDSEWLDKEVIDQYKE